LNKKQFNKNKFFWIYKLVEKLKENTSFIKE